VGKQSEWVRAVSGQNCTHRQGGSWTTVSGGCCSVVSPTVPACGAPLVCVRFVPATSSRRHWCVRARPDGDPAVQQEEQAWCSDGRGKPGSRCRTRVAAQTSRAALIRMEESLNAFFGPIRVFLALSSVRSTVLVCPARIFLSNDGLKSHFSGSLLELKK